jgi:hypothetical protein
MPPSLIFSFSKSVAMTDKFIKGMAAAAFAAAALSAQAADMPLKAKPPETFNWGGCYLGGSLGYAWGRDFDTETVTATGLLSGSSPTDSAKANGVRAASLSLPSRNMMSSPRPAHSPTIPRPEPVGRWALAWITH